MENIQLYNPSIKQRRNHHTIASHRNFGQPFPPTDGSHGGISCQIALSSNGSLNFEFAGCFLPFLLKARGFLSASFSRSFSPYFPIMFDIHLPKGTVPLHKLPEHGVIVLQKCISEAVDFTISDALQNLPISTLSLILDSVNISFNPIQALEVLISVRFDDIFSATIMQIKKSKQVIY